jgi:NarL family two-component system sensor histidine kinase LiaS
MSIVQRQIIFSVLLAVSVLLFLTTVFLVIFPLTNWISLWEQQVMNVPFILFVFLASIGIGATGGLISGDLWRSRLNTLERTLHQLEQGRYSEENPIEPDSVMELDTIRMRIKKIQKQIMEQAKISQKLANEKAKDQEKLIQEMISQERHRLARELHDSVSQQLFAASMLMSSINESRTLLENDPASKSLKMVEEVIHQSQLEMRALLLHLRPVALKGKTLHEGIQELLLELSQKVPMNIQWKIEQIPLDKGIEDHLFRILQESVSNTLRHAKASALSAINPAG